MNKAHGWSLLELLVVLSVITLLAFSAAPSFKNNFERARSERASNALLSQIKNARQHALSTQQETTFCPIKEDKCNKHGAQHIAAFLDKNKNRKIDPEEEIIFHSKITEGEDFLKTRASFGRSYFYFNAEGHSSHGGSIFYCPERPDLYGQIISLNLAGRAYLVKEAEVLSGRIAC
jgi:type IV fimbrial biogenesis protein FimT